ncbi:hypothetical protein ABVQ61_004298 [Escherichia coli]|uniref:hypothetical protein n=1 Tax=Escherichia coli TaxID=562 RepID=UPI000BE50F5A|nr:hypothetical protein [Escherichia coli]EFH8834061.1 hypothetical protein [Escherichia coli]EGJ5940601.1 hypothetical protein [Escherichia coli]ELD1111078.1 hypothetical protein [Escherichia coli]ELD1121625.1 hypothetical protein [Escherichia coli]ELD1133126.1 hypothetical protein [Escherichia coli]
MTLHQILSKELRDLFVYILRRSTFRPPLKVNGDIVSDFTNRCDRFKECLNEFIESEDNLASERVQKRLITINRIQKGITESLKAFLSGDIKSAYDLFDEMLSSPIVYRHIKRISIPLNEICNEDKPLFRVRKSEKPISTRKEIFHIPFTHRHLVNAQRYSVAGLPCLYLGSSLYICWQEMGKPDFDKLYLSSFISWDNESQILNLAAEFLYSRSAKGFYGEIDNNDNLVKLSYLTLWPLIIACNYLKQNDDAPFNPEYIIPNLLMQWISRLEDRPIVGIAYRSTKLTKASNTRRATNVVLPPKVDYEDTVSNPFCKKLSSMFEFTQPVSWQVLKTLDYKVEGELNQEQKKAMRVLESKESLIGIRDLNEDLINLYPLTDFYKLEQCMDRLLQYAPIEVKVGGTLAAEH